MAWVTLSNRAIFPDFFDEEVTVLGRIAITRDTIKAQTISSMKKMGTFEPEYEPIIEIYAGLREQYYRLLAEYQDGKTYRYTTPTADGGEKKSPLSLTIESLRKDILLYSDRLMLNPKARDGSGKKKTSKSKLAEALLNGP